MGGDVGGVGGILGRAVGTEQNKKQRVNTLVEKEREASLHQPAPRQTREDKNLRKSKDKKE